MAYLQSWEHLALLFAVEQVVVVLHRDEGREIVVDGVVCSHGQFNIRCGTPSTYSAWHGLGHLISISKRWREDGLGAH